MNKRRLPFLIILNLIWLSSLLQPVFAQSSEPVISAEAAVLMDYRTGHILFSKNAARKMHPASTTKIITGLLGLELGSEQDLVTVSDTASWTEGTNLGLNSGDRLYLKDLIRGALINSGNDAATAIAQHLGGSVATFASLMNSKAEILGAVQTSFSNPHGLTAWNHLSSAYDLALITRYALKNPEFREIVRTRGMVVYEQRQGRPIALYNTNRLLHQPDISIIGVKTGTTAAAGQCLVAAAEYRGRILISVVLNSDSRYLDTLRLLRYGLEQCHWVRLAERRGELLTLPVRKGAVARVRVGIGEETAYVVRPEEAALVTKEIHLKQALKAPLARGTVVGDLKIYCGEHLLDRWQLVTLEAVPARKTWIKQLISGLPFGEKRFNGSAS